MSKAWPKARLGEVLIPMKRAESPTPGKVYRQIGVKLWGEGVYEREPIDGGSTKYLKLFRVEAGDVIVNKIWARNGSVSVVPEALSGCYGSAEFPIFAPRRDRLAPGWVHWLSKTKDFWMQCDKKSQGTSGKNRIRPEQFLEVEIPLPPLPKQQRIVARIEVLACEINKVHALQRQTIVEAQMLYSNTLRNIMFSSQSKEILLEDACAAIIDNLHSNPRYSDSGIPCVRSPDVGWGTLNLQTAMKTDEEEYRKRIVRGRPEIDDVVFVREGGGIGKCALVLSDQRFSLGQRVMILRPKKQIVDPQFFLYQLLSPSIQEDQIGALCKGSASPHLNISTLRRFHFQLPPMSVQRHVIAELGALQAEANRLKCLHDETAAELKAFLPAILDQVFNRERL